MVLDTYSRPKAPIGNDHQRSHRCWLPVLFASTMALIFGFVGLQEALRVRRVGFEVAATVLDVVAIGLLRSAGLPRSGAWLLIAGSVALPIIRGEDATSQIVGTTGVVVLGAGFARTGIALLGHREAPRA